MGKKTNTVAQGTSATPFDAAAGSNVSYITSFPMGSVNLETRTEAQLNKELYSKSPQERIALATKLKNAGYSVGPINGAVTKNLREAWINAHSDLDNEIKIAKSSGVQAGSIADIDSFLAANAGGGGTGKSGVNIALSQINDTSAAALINSVFRDLTGADAPKEKIAQYTEKIRKAQAANPTKTVYDASGNTRTTGGIDAQQFLTQQVQGTAEAKTNRATDAYAIMMQELGGLR